MATYEVLKYGNPILRKKADRVEQIDDKTKKIVSDMFQTMWSSNGIGLAAIQVGILKRIIVIDLSHLIDDFVPTALINPEITEPEGEIPYEEGCLSVPGIYEEVIRPEKVKVKFQTVDGNTEEWNCAGFLSRVIQHELDHLNGILFIDRISTVKRQLLSSKLKKISKGIPVKDDHGKAL